MVQKRKIKLRQFVMTDKRRESDLRQKPDDTFANVRNVQFYIIGISIFFCIS